MKSPAESDLMQVSITTHLPDLGVVFIEQVARKGILECVVIQKATRKRSLKVKILEFLPSIFRRIYFRSKFQDYIHSELDSRYLQVGLLSEKYGFKIHLTDNINMDSACRSLLESMQSKYLLVLGGRIIKQEIITLFKGCWVNGHGGVLPQYRGLCSEYWAVRNRDHDRMGTTIHLLTHKIDFGGILNVRRIKYSYYHLIFMLEAFNHANLILNYLSTINELVAGTLQEIQFDSTKAQYYSVPKHYALKQYLPVVLLGK